MGLLGKGIVALSVLAVVYGGGTPSPGAASVAGAPGGYGAPAVPGAPAASSAFGIPGASSIPGLNSLNSLNPINPPQVQQPSSIAMKIFNWLGLTKLVSRRFDPLDIPTNLEGKTDEELYGYVEKLMKRRRALQGKMTRHLLYSGFLLYWLRLYGFSPFVKGIVMALYYLNNTYRETINADWMVHQKQLSDFILEYSRVKKEPLDNLPRSKIAGVEYIRLPYSEGGSFKATFPVWVKEKGQELPAKCQVDGTWQMIRNWWLR